MAKKKTLETVLSLEYGIGIVAADQNTILWAAHDLGERYGFEYAKKELSRVNALRKKYGRSPSFPEFGDRLF